MYKSSGIWNIRALKKKDKELLTKNKIKSIVSVKEKYKKRKTKT